MTLFLNPSPLNEKIFECDLEKVEYLISAGNRSTIYSWVACTDEDELVEKLTNGVPNTKIVLTLGENGS